MTQWQIYHNPKCSKSRQALEMLKERGINPDVVLYLQTPLQQVEISALVQKLRLKPAQLLREKEPEYALVAAKLADDQAIIDAIIRYPRLLERPIVVRDNTAVIARPPEKLIELLN